MRAPLLFLLLVSLCASTGRTAAVKPLIPPVEPEEPAVVPDDDYAGIVLGDPPSLLLGDIRAGPEYESATTPPPLLKLAMPLPVLDDDEDDA